MLYTYYMEEKNMTRIQKVLERAGLSQNEGVIIHKPSNIFYLSGYTGEGILVFGHHFQAIITDFRYTEQAENQAPGFQVLMVERGVSHIMLAKRVFDENGITAARFEDDEVTVRSFRYMEEKLTGIALSPLNFVPEQVRCVKDETEIAAIEEACNISCKAFDALLPQIREGMTEKQLQIILDNLMLEMGADSLAFDTIVASGENGSLPHAIPGNRVIQKGDMITFDFGAKKKGYCADMTRTVSVGQPRGEMRVIYETVLKAQEECEKMLRPGISCKEVDLHAHEVIDAAGYHGRFGHGLGHGVGIDIHEEPRLSQGCEDILEEGHIVTVEPGIYVPGLGGVRIENTCVITKDGARTLVHAQKALLIL